VFDSPTAEISFAKLGRKTTRQAVKEIFATQPGRPTPIANTTPPHPVPVGPSATASLSPAEASAQASTTPALTAAHARAGKESGAGAFEKAAAGLIEAGLAFLECIATGAGNEHGLESAATRAPQMLSNLFSRDPQTNRSVLSIPLPESFTQERLMRAVAGFVHGLQTPVEN
jgi:hypothetical protein